MHTPEELCARFCAGAVQARSLDELIGICKGIVADGYVCHREAEYLFNWMEANRSIANAFPANVIYPRLLEMLADGILDDAESQELLAMLEKMTDEQGQEGSDNLSTCIAYDSPLPHLAFVGQRFCLTGSFAFGRRVDVEGRTASLGGEVIKNVIKKGCVLVVGCMGSETWLHSTHGTKIKKAVEDRNAGADICIVSEEHWHKQAERIEQQQEKRARAEAERRVQVRAAMRRILTKDDI